MFDARIPFLKEINRFVTPFLSVTAVVDGDFFGCGYVMCREVRGRRGSLGVSLLLLFRFSFCFSFLIL